MPRVPVYNQQQVAPRAMPLPMQSGISTTVPDGTQALARGLGQVAEVFAREQAYADELRVEDAVNQLRERQLDLTLGQQNGFTNIKGRNVLPGPDGQGLSQRYTQQFEGVARELEGTLANDAQKALFRRYAARSGIEFRSALMRHENAEIENWRKSVLDGVVAVESDNAAKNWNNPEAINLSRSRIDLNLARMREAEGIPADQLEKLRGEAMTRLHMGVINQMVGNRQVDAAARYLETYGDEIAADQALKARKVIEAETDSQYALSAANRVYSQIAPKIEPDDYTRLTNLVFQRESGGRQFGPDGKPITSPKGAVGIAQVMPTTGPEAAKLAGLPWDEERFRNDPEYNAALGRAYLDAQLKKYGGDVAKALAAYNAGPGAVDKAIEKSQQPAPTGKIEGQITAGNIDLAARPRVQNADGSISTVRSMSVNIDGKEILIPTVSDDGRILSDDEAVEQYRRTGKHLGIFSSTEAATKYAEELHLYQEAYYTGNWLAHLPRETREYVPAILSKFQAGAGAPKKPTFAEADAALRADPYLASRPDAYKQAREILKQQYDAQEQAARQRQDEAEGELYRLLIANGGDFYAVPASLRASVNPTKLDTAMNFAAKLRRGEETVTNPALYQRLATDPGYLRNLSDNQFYALRKDLSEADFKHFANERAKALGQQVSNADDLNTDAINRTLNMRLQTMGIDPTPKQDDMAGAARVGAIRQFVTRAIVDAQRAAGKKFTDAEVIQEIDRLFAQSTQLRGFFGGRYNVALLAMKPSDVPSDARDQIKAAFKAAGAPDPSDYDILQVYWAKRFGGRGALSRARVPQQQQNLAEQIPQ